MPMMVPIGLDERGRRPITATPWRFKGRFQGFLIFGNAAWKGQGVFLMGVYTTSGRPRRTPEGCRGGREERRVEARSWKSK